MAKALTNAAIFFGGYTLRTHSNAVAIDIAADEVEETSFANATHINAPGALLGIGVGVSGLWEAPDPDSPLFAALAQAGDVSVAVGPTEGDVAYFLQSLLNRYTPGARVGELVRFDLAVGARDRIVRGRLFRNGTNTASGNGGAGIQLGAVSATQKVYSAIHVTAVSGAGAQLTVNVESDTSGFATPVTRVSHPLQSAIGSSFVSQAGPFADDFWRLQWTIAGTTPSFSWVGLIGII